MRSPGRWATIGLAAVLCAQFGLSLGSTIVKEIGAPGLATAAWRLVFGAVIWMVVLHRRGGRLSARATRLAGPSAVFFAADLALFFVAVTKTSVANAEFIGSLVPVVVVPLAALLFHERVRGLSLAFGAVALAGVAVILFTAPASGISTPAGNLLAFIAMGMWAGYLLSARRARAVLGTSEFMTTVAVLAAIILVPIAAISGKLWEVPAAGWKYIVLLAVLTGTVCHGLLAWAQTRVPGLDHRHPPGRQPGPGHPVGLPDPRRDGDRRAGRRHGRRDRARWPRSRSRAGAGYHLCSTTGSSEDRRAERVAAVTDPRT